MSLRKRLFIGGAAADDSCKTDKADIFGDNSGIALYSLDYDASDASGNYDGTPSNVTFGDIGQINYAASFNGSDSKITLPTGSPFNDSDTIKCISAWIKPNTTTSNVYIFSLSSTTDSKDYFTFDWIQSTWSGVPDLRVRVQNGGSSQRLDATVGVTATNEWKHVVAQLGSSEVELFIDGVKQTVTFSKAGSATDAWWISNISYATAVQGLIGQYRAVTPLNADGLIDQVRLFNKALSQSEVDTLYAEERCVYDSTTDNNALGGTNVAYYKFDSDATDETSNNNDGTWSGTESYIFGRYGAAARFGGSEKITISSFTTLSQLGFSGWVKADDVSGTWTVAAKYDSNDREFAIYCYQGTLYAIIYYNGNNGNSTSVTAETYMNDKQWHHIAYTADGTNAPKLWIDGVERGSPQYTDSVRCAYYSTSQPLTLGRFASNSSPLNGELDQIRICNSALDQDDVDALYAERQEHITLDSTDPFGDSDLVQYLKLDNGLTAAVGTDATNNGATFSTDRLFGTHSASFDGFNDYIDTNRVFAYGDTISVWFYVNGLFGSAQTVPILGQYTATYVFYNIWLVTNTSNELQVRTYLRNTASNYLLFQSSTPERVSYNTGWHHLVVHPPSILGTPDVYIDGVKQGMYKSSHVGTLTYMPNTDAVIGNIRVNGTHYYLDGKLDQYRVFDRKLTGEEAYQLYAEGILDE